MLKLTSITYCLKCFSKKTRLFSNENSQKDQKVIFENLEDLIVNFVNYMDQFGNFAHSYQIINPIHFFKC